jgi:hypothetical protein
MTSALTKIHGTNVLTYSCGYVCPMGGLWGTCFYINLVKCGGRIELTIIVAHNRGVYIEFKTNIDYAPQHTLGSLNVWERRVKLRHEQRAASGKHTRSNTYQI